MSEATATLQALRRNVGRELRMPFYRRYSAGYSEIDATSTTSKIIDASLTQKDGFWNGAWFYRVTSQEPALVRFFQASTRSLNLEVNLAATPSAGDDYELLEGHSPLDVHYAINQAISEGGRTWPDTITDETLVLEEDKLQYSISALSRTMWILLKVYIESRPSVQRGTLVSASSTGFVVSSSSVFNDVVTASQWRISIYSGTGTGQIRTLSSNSGTSGVITAAWTTVPDSTSKFAFWNASEDETTWIPVNQFRLDAKEYPDYLYFHRKMDSLLGMRIRLEYLSEPSALSAESDTTTVPSRWIIPYAAHLLLGQKIKDVKTDREVLMAESERYRMMAEDYRIKNAPVRSDVMMRRPVPSGNVYPAADDLGNPLDWR